jgi:hypothetical protein
MKLLNKRLPMAIALFSLLSLAIDNNSSIAQTLDINKDINIYQNSIEAILKAIELNINVANLQPQTGSNGETSVSFRELIAYLPEPPRGWTADKPFGETSSFGDYNVSQVNQTFRQGSKKVKISIFDSAFNSALYTPFLLSTKFSRESTEGYSKGIKINNIAGREEYDYNTKKGSLNLLVDSRFLVQIDGHNIEDIDLRYWWELIDRQSLITYSSQ